MHPFGNKMAGFCKIECVFLPIFAKKCAFLCEIEPTAMQNTAPMLTLIILPTSAKCSGNYE